MDTGDINGANGVMGPKFVYQINIAIFVHKIGDTHTHTPIEQTAIFNYLYIFNRNHRQALTCFRQSSHNPEVEKGR